MKQFIELNINGEAHEIAVEPGDTLLRALRERAGLTGTKRGCDSGGCGCCTVLVDGKAVYSCMTFALSVRGKSITSVEGLAVGGVLDPIQEAFIKAGAVQCGYCTCGIMMAAKQLLAENSKPSEHEIRHAIAGNLCRCTGYQKIIQAIQLAAAAG
ncbi:MAG: (2Fe-2S)-binding protein [Gammaproteobacteria bacterium RIFCSPLOWO2_02_FULL_61_13]|nr:MAG: (2Fe-2S)-binding protein [Gammaproteobacteria bacterium RIFCSPLOWO2_02_FULL_61_13]